MGLIRSGFCALTPESSEEELTACLWPIVREVIKTAVENGQNLIVEGCYIPFDWHLEFDASYRSRIHFWCLIFSLQYIETHYDDIFRYEHMIEKRQSSSSDYLSRHFLAAINTHNLNECRRYDHNYILIDSAYDLATIVEEVMASV